MTRIRYFTLIGGNITAIFPHHYHVEPAYVIALVYPITLFLSCLTDLTYQMLKQEGESLVLFNVLYFI